MSLKWAYLSYHRAFAFWNPATNEHVAWLAYPTIGVLGSGSYPDFQIPDCCETQETSNTAEEVERVERSSGTTTFLASFTVFPECL
jgi:hypothetical protein